MKWNIFIILSISVLCMCLKRSCVALLPDSFVVHMDTRFSESTAQLITQQLHEYKQKKKSIQYIVKNLEQEFPCIKQCSIQTFPCECVMYIRCQIPEYILNDSFVLTSNGMLIDQSFFKPSSKDDIPSIRVGNDMLSDESSLLLWLRSNVKPCMHESYTVDMVNKHYVLFTEKNNTHFSIVCSSEQSDIFNFFDQCQQVKNNLNENKMFTQNASWLADTRFSHYIVAYRA